MNVHTWANGFGIWHVRISRSAASPLIAARRALRDKLTARESRANPTARAIYTYPVRVPELDDERTIVYREGATKSEEIETYGRPLTNDERSAISTGRALVIPGDPYSTIEIGTLRCDDDGRPVVREAECGECGFRWNDALITGITPTPAGRCPNEYAHAETNACPGCGMLTESDPDDYPTECDACRESDSLALKPRHDHDCDACTLVALVGPVDVYECPNSGGMVARLSDEPSDYHSGSSVDLAYALRIARARLNRED